MLARLFLAPKVEILEAKLLTNLFLKKKVIFYKLRQHLGQEGEGSVSEPVPVLSGHDSL